MVASADFAEFLSEQLAPLGHLAIRRMFGKSGVFCDGIMLGMVRSFVHRAFIRARRLTLL